MAEPVDEVQQWHRSARARHPDEAPEGAEGAEATDGYGIRRSSDESAIRARLAAHALPAIGQQYAARYGSPLEQEQMRQVASGQRWAMSRRAVLAGALIVLCVAGVLGWRAVNRAPGHVMPLSSLEIQSPGGASGGEPSTPDDSDAPGEQDGTEHRPGSAGQDGSTGQVGTTEQSTGTDPDGSGSAPETEFLIVHVVGQVKDPGIVMLAPGARVFDAVEAAGGVTKKAELSSVNLARIVGDGEQIMIPAHGQTPAPEPPGGAPGHSPARELGPGSGVVTAPVVLLDLNTADSAAFESLPGIGPVLAQRIVDHRESNGPFRAVDQLLEVSGIGPSIMAQIKDKVRV